jgi:arginine exporter protein ArgO
MQHTKIFYIFSLLKTQTSPLIATKVNKPHISQILKTLINQLLNPKKYIETCSYIFTGNTT